jgi:hypothetical protein
VNAVPHEVTDPGWYSVRFGPKQQRQVGSMDLGGARPPAGSRSQMARPNAVQALFFGDFLLGQQKKVTRPPGRDPAPFK